LLWWWLVGQVQIRQSWWLDGCGHLLRHPRL